MKLVISLLASLALFVSACGPAETCTSQACGSAKTYQTCSTAGVSTIVYRYGGANCSCDVATMSCADCQKKVATWCAQ